MFVFLSGKDSEEKSEESTLHFWVTFMLCLCCSVIAIGFVVYLCKLRQTTGEILHEKRDGEAHTGYQATTEH